MSLLPQYGKYRITRYGVGLYHIIPITNTKLQLVGGRLSWSLLFNIERKQQTK